MNDLLHPTARTIPVQYTTRYYCPLCRRVVTSWLSHGRWDPERQATAIPFEHVATTFVHYKEDLPNCVTGNPSLAEMEVRVDAPCGACGNGHHDDCIADEDARGGTCGCTVCWRRP